MIITSTQYALMNFGKDRLNGSTLRNVDEWRDPGVQVHSSLKVKQHSWNGWQLQVPRLTICPGWTTLVLWPRKHIKTSTFSDLKKKLAHFQWLSTISKDAPKKALEWETSQVWFATLAQELAKCCRCIPVHHTWQPPPAPNFFPYVEGESKKILKGIFFCF